MKREKYLNKRVTEAGRSRYIIKGHRRHKNTADLESLPERESMRSSFIVPGKYTSSIKERQRDKLNPFYRFLDSRVGHPWDKVYSELCEMLKNDLQKYHLLIQHLSYHLEENPVYGKNGIIYHSQAFRYIHAQLKDRSLYVDKQGILRMYFFKDIYTRVKEDPHLRTKRVNGQERQFYHTEHGWFKGVGINEANTRKVKYLCRPKRSKEIWKFVMVEAGKLHQLKGMDFVLGPFEQVDEKDLLGA